MKAYKIEAFDITGYYIAKSRGKARYHAAMVLEECSYVRDIGEAFLAIRCTRAPEFDWFGVGKTITGHIPTDIAE